MLIDLHLHSTYSDGYLTPYELGKFVARHKIKIASLTDHNTVRGLDEFRLACAKSKIKFITGLELYVQLEKKKFNLSWYNFDDKDPALHNVLRDIQTKRRASVRRTLNKLSEYGFTVNTEAILDKYNHYVPINHIVDDIFKIPANKSRVKKEIGPDVREDEMISKYFYNSEIGRLSETYIEINKVINLRKKIGGQLVLNHPGKFGFIEKIVLEKLRKIGVDGLEVLSPHHSIGAVMFAQFIAEKNKFIWTGGSDFHRFEDNGARIQHAWEYFKIDSKNLKGIEKIIG